MAHLHCVNLYLTIPATLIAYVCVYVHVRGVLVQVSIFMTHANNYAADRLAEKVFLGLVNFIEGWTNLQLKWDKPTETAKKYFDIFPEDQEPVWEVILSLRLDAECSDFLCRQCLDSLCTPCSFGTW